MINSPHIPFITGVGWMTPFGSSTIAWQKLMAGGAINCTSRAELAAVPSYPSENLPPRVHLLAGVAVGNALADAGWDPADLHDVAIIVGTSKGAADDWLESIAEPTPERQQTIRVGIADLAAVLAGELKCCGPRLTLSGACASGLLALARAGSMIAAGEVRRALVVAADSSLHPLFLGSFKRLGVLAPDGHGCRPFDKTREGFVVSESAAAVCLEAHPTKYQHAVELENWASGADAMNLTAADPDAVVLRDILTRVIDGRRVDLVHAHGTGTQLNDPAELAAIEATLLADSIDRPALYSHKGALGHSLGASGLVSVVINVLCHRNQCVPPNPNTTQPLETHRIQISAASQPRTIQRSIAAAAGFGGSVAAVSLVNRQ